MKKFIAVLLMLTLVLTFSACAGGGGGGAEPAPAPAPAPAAPSDNSGGGLIKVGIVNNPPSESGYREANVRDFETVFTEANGYDVKTFYSLTNDEQLNAAKQFITEGVDYILLSAAATDGWDGVLSSAQQAGIKVFLFDRMINADESLFEAAVVSDMANQGNLAVSWLTDQGLDAYNVVHIQGVMGSDAQIGRSTALEKAVGANDNWSLVVQQTASWDEAEAKKIVESVINSGEKFNVVYAENDGMARGAVAALDEAGISHGVDKDVIIMGFDCNTWALEELLKGNWNYNGQCSPFQAVVIDAMIKALESGSALAEKIVISEEKGFDARTITQADVDTYGI